MQDLEWVGDTVGLLAGILLLALLFLMARRRLLGRDGTTFEMSVNRRSLTSWRGWTLGLGRYTDQELQWYRIFAVDWRPSSVFRRGLLDVRRRRDPEGAEQFAIYGGHVVIECESEGQQVQLSLSPQALTGLLAWLESAPPGRHSDRVV